MALSSLLTEQLWEEVDRAARDQLDTLELKALTPLFERQRDLSRLPRLGEFLIKNCRRREGPHL